MCGFVAYNYLKQFFYSSENWTDNQKKVFLTLYGLPPWKQAADYFYNKRRAEEWWHNNPDVPWHNPTNIPGADASGDALSGFKYTLGFMSKNIDRLYR